MIATYPEITRIDLPATTKHLSILSACIAEVIARIDGLREHAHLTYAVQLAAHEACANIIEHAYAGMSNQRVEIMITIDDRPLRVIIDMYDSGQSFDLAHTPAPNLDQPQMRGYGLHILRSLMDEVAYHPAKGKNHWHLVKHLIQNGET